MKIKAQNKIRITAAAVLALIILLCIKWNPQNKILGDDYICHIYYCNEYILIYTNWDPDKVSFGPDNYYKDKFEFRFDPSGNNYKIIRTISGKEFYLCASSDQTLILTDDVDDKGTGWTVRRSGSTMFYNIISDDTGLAVSRSPDTPQVQLLPLREGHPFMLMRLEDDA